MFSRPKFVVEFNSEVRNAKCDTVFLDIDTFVEAHVVCACSFVQYNACQDVAILEHYSSTCFEVIKLPVHATSGVYSCINLQCCKSRLKLVHAQEMLVT